ncbi:protein NRT1/ PTR FAMILY 1.1-like [Mangifera indica]|uniref:protein NRT1/ PTR FAMILY 1.1-like n=1 Tax=Mangifera indica TaxID=29780 RepID=UPI001CFBCD46|nr:protein NRT1/ PTR FAMILY 1.1-like [Mangifera indica]
MTFLVKISLPCSCCSPKSEFRGKTQKTLYFSSLHKYVEDVKLIVAEVKMESSLKENMIQQSSRPKKGGFRTMPFIIVNESFEKVAGYGLMPNMILYLMSGYHIATANGAAMLAMWSAASNAMAIVGAFLSDSYIGRFWAILLGSFSSLLGIALLWLTAMIPQLKPPPCTQFSSNCESATPVQLLVLLTSFGLISIGAGCIRPCSMAFGADQLDKKDRPNNERLIQSFFNWYYASIGVSTIMALTLIIYIQDQLGWKVGFGIPALLMVFSTVIFLMGSNLYIKVKVEKSLFTGFIQVIVAAFRKRNLDVSDNNLEYYQGQGTNIYITPTEKLRCLNKACLMENSEDLKPDRTASNPWKLCSIDQVESLKALLRIIPMWSTSIIVLVTLNQNSFAALQAKTMDRHVTSNFQIPAGSFTVFAVVTLTIWVATYDRVIVPILQKFTGNPCGFSPKIRMGSGLILSAVAMTVSAMVESMRRKTAIYEGLVDKPNIVMHMSAVWLIPQFCLLGLAEALNAIGQIEFYYSQLPKAMSSIAIALYTLGIAFADLFNGVLVKIVDGVTKQDGKESWLSNNLNKGHLDYYYWVITMLCVVNFGLFLVCCGAFGPSSDWKKVPSKIRLERKEDTSPLI